MKDPEKAQSKIINLLRWLAFFPVAFIAGFVAQSIIGIINGVPILRYYEFYEPGSLVHSIWIQCLSNLGFGAVFVGIGTYIAPAHKKIVAICLAGFVLIASGALLLIGILIQEYWSILFLVSLNLGSVGVVVSVFKMQSETQESFLEN